PLQLLLRLLSVFTHTPTTAIHPLSLHDALPIYSATSIALTDAVRDRVNQLVKSKVMVVTKAKLCEALAQSGFPCNGLLDDSQARSEEHTSELQSRVDLVCRLLLEKKKKQQERSE